MRVFRHISATGADRGAVVAVGNFDGVHRGHQAIIAGGKQSARDMGAPFAVLTFEPHPRSVFQPGAPPFRLTPFRAKSRALENLGVDLLFTLHFDLDFAKKSAE
jgi:riboflavin kinase/FMN adenylyltransferase